MRAHRRVVLTRTPEDNAALRRELGEIDALVIDDPCLSIDRGIAADRVIEHLRAGVFDAAVFVSRHAVEAIADPSVPQPKQVVALGKATAKALEARGWKVTALPSEARAEIAAQELDALLPGATRVLYPTGELNEDVIPKALENKGVHVERFIVYRTVDPGGAPLPPYEGRTLVVFGSPSAVNHFYARNRIDSRMEFLAIGQTTAKRCGQLAPTRVADEPSSAGLARAIRDWMAG